MASKKLIEKVENIVFEAMLHGSHPRNVAEAAISTILAALQDPTYEMQRKGERVTWEDRTTIKDVWRAMLNASPLGEQSE